MARVLFAAWPYDGHVNPCLAVARLLAERGHEVAFYTGAAAARSVREDGFERFAFGAVASRLSEILGTSTRDDGPELYSALTQRYTTVGEQNALRKVRTMRAMYHEMIVGTLRAQVEDLDDIVIRWRPDAVVSDVLLWAPFLVLHETTAVRVAAFCFFSGCLIPGRDAPPAGFGLPSPRNWRTRRMAGVAGAVTRALTRDVRQEADRVRQSYGLSPLRESVAAFTGRMPLYLVASTPEFDYQRRDLPPSVEYVGPCLRDRARGASTPDWLRELPMDPPVVYVSEGTAQVREPVLLRAAAEGLAGLRVSVVMTTGRQRATADVGPVPGNVRLERYVPHGDLFPKARVIVTNGGSGTVREALRAGVPLVIVPMEWDQLDNAQRVAETGVGVRIPLARCSPASIGAAVRQVLADPSYARNAAELARRFAEYGEGRRAADAIERLFNAPAPVNARGLRDDMATVTS